MDLFCAAEEVVTCLEVFWRCVEPVGRVCLGFVSGVSHTQHLSLMGFVVVFSAFKARTVDCGSVLLSLPPALPPVLALSAELFSI